MNTAIGPNDHHLLHELRRMWEALDPPDDDLASRILFRLELEDLEAEVMSLQELSVAGARGTETARTVTFVAERITVMVTASLVGRLPGRQHHRLDGWIAPSAALRIELHGGETVRAVTADEDGRFVFDEVSSGPIRLMIYPTPGAAVDLDRPVSTPATQF
jgi:hypothetical protein